MNNEMKQKYQAVSASDGGNQAWSKEVKSELITELKNLDCELLLDWEVTIDPRRIIRLPGTVHGKTLRLCTITSPEDFNLVNGRWTYNASPPI
jgi:DNA primase catalytic subunit